MPTFPYYAYNRPMPSIPYYAYNMHPIPDYVYRPMPSILYYAYTMPTMHTMPTMNTKPTTLFFYKNNFIRIGRLIYCSKFKNN